jgi:hypothetical protein
MVRHKLVSRYAALGDATEKWCSLHIGLGKSGIAGPVSFDQLSVDFCFGGSVSSVRVI